MKCDCNNIEMDYVECYDTGSSGEDISYNVYKCDYCGTIKIEHVWDNARIITIPASYDEDIKVDIIS